MRITGELTKMDLPEEVVKLFHPEPATPISEPLASVRNMRQLRRELKRRKETLSGTQWIHLQARRTGRSWRQAWVHPIIADDGFYTAIQKQEPQLLQAEFIRINALSARDYAFEEELIQVFLKAGYSGPDNNPWTGSIASEYLYRPRK